VQVKGLMLVQDEEWVLQSVDQGSQVPELQVPEHALYQVEVVCWLGLVGQLHWGCMVCCRWNHLAERMKNEIRTYP
jgi:hypothetical protein